MTVNSLISNPIGTELQNPVRSAIAETNSVLTGCSVPSLFHASCVDLETGKHGIRWLIARILSEASAVFPKFNGNFRNIYLAYGLTTDEIIGKVRQVNGFDKYPDKTIRDNLSIVMFRSRHVDCVQMTSAEDDSRSCKRPRVKWYLVTE